MKNLNLDSCKLNIMDLGKDKRIHINLKRYKKPLYLIVLTKFMEIFKYVLPTVFYYCMPYFETIQTQTLYSSIEQNDKAYTEIWLDKQNKKVVGIKIMWGER